MPSMNNIVRYLAGECCGGGQEGCTAPSNMLSLDISGDKENYYIRASLPGFRKEEIGLEVKDGVLEINASFDRNEDESSEQYHRRERKFGNFSRKIRMPEGTDETTVTATLDNGVLTVVVPQPTAVQPTKINVN